MNTPTPIYHFVYAHDPVLLPPGTIVYAYPLQPQPQPQAQPPLIMAPPATIVANPVVAPLPQPLPAPSYAPPPSIAWERARRMSFMQRNRYPCAGIKRHRGKACGRCSILVRLLSPDPSSCFCWYHRDDYHRVSEEQREEIRNRLGMAIDDRNKTMVELAMEQLSEYVEQYKEQ